MEGATFATISVKDEFQERYRKRFGNDDRITFAANAYDFAMLTNSIFDGNTTRPSVESILDAFRNGVAQETASESMRFVDEPETGAGFSFPVIVKKVLGGGFVRAGVNCGKP